MKIKFCGAAQYVTGSSHLIELSDGYKILLDCGMYQGKGKNIWEWNNQWHFDPSEIDCLVLSHAHIDHSGRIPKLVKDGFKGSIHCTHATRSICAVMLMDSAKIQETDVEWHNKKVLTKRKRGNNKMREPLYTKEDVSPAMVRFEGHPYDVWEYISPNVQVLLRDAGHIFGSASVTLKIIDNGKEILVGFTGDIGRPMRPIIKDPHPMPELDYLICESTYGNRLHESAPEQSEAFLQVIKETCVNKKGKLIIPAFSLGRTQELVYMLDKMETAGLLPHIPIYVDSPLAVNVTQIFNLHPECFDEEINNYLQTEGNPFGFENLHYVKDVEASKRLNHSKEPCIIISASGMMNAGRVKHHLFNSMDNPNNTILIVGYCTPETPGGQLLAGAKTLNIFDTEKEVRADVVVMSSFSGHGDQNEMYDFIENQKGRVKEIFLVHGELSVQEEFKIFLEGKGFPSVRVPELGSVFEIKSE